MSEGNERLANLIIEGDEESARRLTQQLIDEGQPARGIVDDGLLAGMDVVGARMRAGECFIPEVLLSARTMQACLDMIKPHLAAGDSGSTGKVVIGTVEGDVHDIGKNLVGMMLEGAGFEVINLGTGISPTSFVDAVREQSPQIIGMSGLLTTTIPRMGETVKLLKDAGLRDSVKVMVGGAPVTQRFADEVGADAYGANAAAAVDRARELVGTLAK